MRSSGLITQVQSRRHFFALSTIASLGWICFLMFSHLSGLVEWDQRIFSHSLAQHFLNRHLVFFLRSILSLHTTETAWLATRAWAPRRGLTLCGNTPGLHLPAKGGTPSETHFNAWSYGPTLSFGAKPISPEGEASLPPVRRAAQKLRTVCVEHDTDIDTSGSTIRSQQSRLKFLRLKKSQHWLASFYTDEHVNINAHLRTIMCTVCCTARSSELIAQILSRRLLLALTTMLYCRICFQILSGGCVR